MSIIQRNLDRLSVSQAVYNDNVAASLGRIPTTAFVQGFDTNKGKVVVKALDGSTYRANPITTGAIGLRDQVSLQLQRGVSPAIDAMPR